MSKTTINAGLASTLALDTAFLSEELYIGEHLKLITDKLVSAGHALTAVLDTSEAFFVDNLLSSLESHPCRIAVIGQVNAGKSSLINAFIGRPGLLPTGMDPRTAVLTRLNFGDKKHLPSTAHFTLFTPQEWEKMAAQSGPDQSPTEPAIAAHALVDLARRADEHSLTSAHSTFKKPRLLQSITKDTLEAFIAEPSANQEIQENQKSKITKAADLFFDSSPFRYPTVLIDTPGVNHPTRMRGTISWENINEADIYLVMIKATEGLSSAEVALLRTLHTLRENRIILLINHIDVTVTEAADWRAVVHAIKQQLSVELPEAQFPIILTSAYWAERALDADALDLNIFSPTFITFASEMGLNTELMPLRSITPSNQRQVAAMLFACSGIPALAQEINSLMTRADCFIRTYDTLINLLRLSDINLSLRGVEKDRYQSLLTAYQTSTALNTHTIDELKHQLDAFQLNHSQINNTITQLEITMNASVSQGLDIIEKNLLETLRLYAMAEPLKQDAAKSDSITEFFSESTNAIALKRYVSSKIIESYRQLKREIFLATLEGHGALNDFIGHVLPEDLNERTGMLPWFEKRMPAFIPVSQSIEVDMNDFLQRVKVAKEKDPSSDITVAWVRAEFSSLLEKLLHNMKTDLTSSVHEEVAKLRVVANFMTTRLNSVLEQQICILEDALAAPESERTNRLLATLAKELDRVADLELESRATAKMLRGVYLIVLNKRSAPEHT